jgi:DNA primase
MTEASLDYGEIKKHARFEQILVNYGLETTGRGAEKMTWCPFHDDSSPSCSINLEKKLFNCFACGESGSILDFVAKMEQCSIYEAAGLIELWCSLSDGVNKNAGNTSKSMWKPEKTIENEPLDFELHLDATHSYLRDRGVSPETVRKFGLGYCDHGIMKGRICIPVHDADGCLVAYAGRWPERTSPPEEPRYKFPRGFKKRLVLFNLHRVRMADVLVIVEGCWSVFRLDALGVASVALMGRSLSADQEQLILDAGVRRIILLLDGDDAGRSATVELLPRLSSHLFVHALIMPDGAEPDTMDETALRAILR